MYAYGLSVKKVTFGNCCLSYGDSRMFQISCLAESVGGFSAPHKSDRIKRRVFHDFFLDS